MKSRCDFIPYLLASVGDASSDLRARTAVGARLRIRLDRCPCQNPRPCLHLLHDALDGVRRLRTATSVQLTRHHDSPQPVYSLAGEAARARNHAPLMRDAIPTRENSVPPIASTQDGESSLGCLRRVALYSKPARVPRPTRPKVLRLYWCRQGR